MTPEELLAADKDSLSIIDINPKKPIDTNINCNGCHNCVNCNDCIRCVDCINCLSCRYCYRSIDCIDCLKCNDCIGIKNGNELNFVAYGVQLTEEQYIQFITS